MTFLFALTGLGVTGLSLLVHAAFCAPEGYEDAGGFHFVTPSQPEPTALVQSPVENGGLGVFSR